MTTTTKAITPQQLKCISTLIARRGIAADDKKVMVAGFSNQRCHSSRLLYYHEAFALIKHLQTLQPHQAAAAKMRNKILYYAHEMNWENAPGHVDMQRVDNWCIKFSYLHKKLNQYEYQELPRLISQMQQVYKHYLANL